MSYTCENLVMGVYCVHNSMINCSRDQQNMPHVGVCMLHICHEIPVKQTVTSSVWTANSSYRSQSCKKYTPALFFFTKLQHSNLKPKNGNEKLCFTCLTASLLSSSTNHTQTRGRFCCALNQFVTAICTEYTPLSFVFGSVHHLSRTFLCP